MSEKCEVVISGISGRFPEAESVNDYKQMLYNSINPITYDNRKWPTGYRFKLSKEVIPCGTGKFMEPEKYDNTVFAVSPYLANQVDIVNRMVLEPSFEAILDAGINPNSLMGANVACYITCGISEAESVKLTSFIEKLSLIGASKGMLSNRVSFALNLTGPSITYYSGICGGIEALTAAYENLTNGRIEAAIVGASSSLIDPKLSFNHQLMGVLSSDGLCRAFDAQANGYGRSDGVVMMYLQRAQDAKRSYGTLMFCDSMYRGLNTKSIIGFDDEYLEDGLREIYATHKNVSAADISFLEMDANGVKMVDEREVHASARFFCKGRKEPLLIGSAKSHTGNTESVSGYVSLLKACLALDSDYIAPNMHFSNPNPNIASILNNKMKLVLEPTKLPGPIVAVNSISMAGVIGHAVIKQNPRTKDETNTDDTLSRLLILCGRSKDDMVTVLQKIEKEPLNKEFVAMVNDIFKTPLPSHMYRGYTILPAPANPLNGVEIMEGENRPVWFVFSGMGSQWNGMGRDLLQIPIFAETVDRCDRVLRPKGIDIRHILTSNEPTLFDDIVNAFVGIITVQIGLMNILNAIGIQPNGIIGHSVGENACAYADGCLTLEQAVLASYARGVASNEAETIKGMMAAIGRGYDQIKDELPEGIEVACHNAADNCTLTGPAAQVNEFVEKLQRENIFARTINVSNIAYHSKHIRPAAPILLKRLNEVIKEPKERSEKWVSTSVPETNWNDPLAKTCSAEYLTNNLVSAVLFEEGCKHIPENAVVVEIAPHGLLQAILKRSLRSTNTNISLTLRSAKTNTVNFMLSAIGKLFISGCQPNVNALYPQIEYPVPRGTPSTSSIATWDHTQAWKIPEPLRERPLSEEPIQIKLNKGTEFAFIKAHQIRDQTIIPPSLYMYLTWQFLSVLRKEQLGRSNIVFEDIKVHRQVHISIDKYRTLSIMIQHGSGNFEVLLETEKDPDHPKTVMTGVIQVPYEKVDITVDESPIQTAKVKLSGEEFYKKLESVGYQLEEGFKLVQELQHNDTEYYGKITWNGNWTCFLDAVMKLFMYSDNRSVSDLQFMSRFRKLTICTSAFSRLNPGDEVVWRKDIVLQKLWCNGLDLISLESNAIKPRYLQNKNEEFDLQGLQFISHANPNLQSISDFFSFCLHLATESAENADIHAETKLHLVDTAHALKMLKDIISKNSILKSKIVFSDGKNFTAGKYHEKKFYLVVVNSLCSLSKLQMLKNELGSLYVLVIASLTDTGSSKHTKAFVEVTRQIFGDVSVYLFKKLPESNGLLPPVMVADNHWQTKLAPILKSKKSQPIVLLRHSVELADLSVIRSKHRQYPNVRFLFILDDQAPTFSTENLFYKNQILQGLPVAVLKNGQWGSYRNLENNSQKTSSNEFHVLDVPLSDFRLKAVDLRYLDFNCEFIDANKETGIREYGYGLEFSGISDSSKRIMGLGYYNPLESLHEPDEQLSWSVPKHWSLEDACTVPLIYSQVYHALFIAPWQTVEENRSILLNSENMSLTEATIAVALYHNREIYVTVASNTEADILSKRFPCLNREHILERTDCKYEVQLKLLTKGKGVPIVINSIKEWEHLNAAISCLSILGIYIDFTDRTYDDASKLGMSLFLNSVTFESVPHNIMAFLRLPTDTKKVLHSLVEQGIKEGVVRPLPRSVRKDETTMPTYRMDEIENVKQVYKRVSKEDILSNKVTAKLKCDENHSFIIISGGRKTKLWFELVEWLISRGARKFIVALDNFSVDPKLSHQINRILIQKKATIILTTSKKADTVDEAGTLIAEANQIAPLEAVFFVSLDPAGPVIENFDVASSSGTSLPHFISLFSGGLKECERRRRKDLPSILIHSEKAIQNLSPVFEQMERVLLSRFHDSSPSLYYLVDKYKTKNTVSSFFHLSDFLSFDSEKLLDAGYYATETPEFIEVSSLARKMSELKQQLPIFIIPGVDFNFIKPLTSKIVYPTFCATFTETCGPAVEVAEQLMKHLVKIQPRGPVTIVGETWSGAAAIELATLVQATGRKVELLLIEGSPFTWQNYIRTLGEINTSQFHNTLLKEILNTGLKGKPDSENQNSNYSWEEYLDRYVKNLKCSVEDQKNLKKAINGIRSRLIMTAKHEPSGKFLNHVVLFKQRPSASSMDKYCLSDDVHLFEEDKYKNFLSAQEMNKLINHNALFTWNP